MVNIRSHINEQCFKKFDHRRVNSAPHLKIEGGVDAAPGEYPFLVSLETCVFGICENECGGAIINDQWVLTAGWCIPVAERITAGALKLNDNNTEKQTFKVKKLLPIQIYVDGGYPYDIALLKLDKTVKFNDLVQSASLPVQGTVPNGTASLVSYRYNLLPDRNVQKVAPNMDIITFDECHEKLDQILTAGSINPLNSSYNMCTDPWGGKSVTCNGDTGSPLAQNGTIIGLVTWFLSPCGFPSGSNVFTNVALFVDWISQTIQDNQ